MEKINYVAIDNSDKKKREKYSDIEKFFSDNKCRDGKILVLYGLRRTGKTTLIEQLLDNYDETSAVYYQATKMDCMNDINKMIIEAKNDGIKIVCIDEITKVNDFVENSAILSDIFAKNGINIIVAGTDSLGFLFAAEGELLDRICKIQTTHIPFAEHCEVLDINDIDDYIQFGGLMKKGEPKERYINDYESACKYLDSSVADNIAHSIKSSDKETSLDKLKETDIRLLIKKLVEKYSGRFDVKNIKSKLSKVSVNYPVSKLNEIDVDDNIIEKLVYDEKKIRKEFLDELNISGDFSVEIDDKMVLETRKFMMDMDVLSFIKTIEYDYHEELGWIEGVPNFEYYIIQPAIKYYFLEEGKKFIEEKDFYRSLTSQQKNFMQNKLDEKIKGDMTEQIVIFDTSKDLDKRKYMVCKPTFKENKNPIGEYDMLIYDKNKNSYWAFEIKHTSNPYYKQEQYITNPFLKEVIDNNYGHRENVAVLYRGNPFKSETGTFYFNITDFMKAVHKYRDIDLVFNVLSKNIAKKNIYENKANSQENKTDFSKKGTVINKKSIYERL